ncbi:polyphosphate polymerase domain-containing protein [Streptomyces sulphureus]|uniref:polyphosphate polymerase domain-containing protein n=1 Tax=Streptomyces sulphureus TaxID=47758 RepID=UPI0003729B54|nr:polyphosphate polymerase domain-containing protein [Streptomyces sulphureus]
MSLGEVVSNASLLVRIDRAYLVPVPVFTDLVARLTDRRRRDSFRVLEIGGRRCFSYHSVYYDTAGLRTFHDHRQGRRQRYKARERLYVDSGERWFEVKLKGRRSETVKHRQPLSERAAYNGALREEQHRFLRETLWVSYGVAPPSALRPSLVTDYVRLTFAAAGQRVTCDAGLVCRDEAGDVHGGGATVHGSDDLLVVETKSTGHLSDVDRLLHGYGIRAAEFTKYASLAALRPSLPGNRWRRALRQMYGSLA